MASSAASGGSGGTAAAPAAAATTDAAAAAASPSSYTVIDGQRMRPRKCAVLFGYCGSAYQGLQVNPGAHSVEGELAKAMNKCGLVHECVTDGLTKIRWSRTARTDKGVHAARQVVSLKIIPHPDAVSMLNKELPDDIRVFKLIRATKSFDCKLQCTGRRYEYLTPTYTFTPKDQEVSVDFRLSPEGLAQLNKYLGAFVGTHNFHNYTSGKTADDRSSNRYITKMEASAPIIRSGIEFTLITVEGQSFMLNQIRRMVGMVMTLMQGLADEDYLQKTLSAERYSVPRAPGVGLTLDTVFFKEYNAKRGKDKESDRELMDFEDVDGEVTAFKDEYIWKKIVSVEAETKEQLTYACDLRTMPLGLMSDIYTYPRPNSSAKRQRLNPDGEEEDEEDEEEKVAAEPDFTTKRGAQPVLVDEQGRRVRGVRPRHIKAAAAASAAAAAAEASSSSEAK